MEETEKNFRREFHFNGNKTMALRHFKSVSVNGAEAKDYILFRTPHDENLILDSDLFSKLIPTRLYKGDMVMFVSHGKLHGTTDVVSILCDCVTIRNFPSYLQTNVMPQNIAEDGLIYKGENYEIYLYHPEVCRRLGFQYESVHNEAIKRVINSTTTCGDKSVITITNSKGDNNSNIYTVQVEIHTQTPDDYGPDYAVVSEVGDWYVISSKFKFQYKTWQLIADEIRKFQKRIGGEI